MSVSLCLVDSCSQNWYVGADVILIIAKPMCHDTIRVFLVLYVLVIYCSFL